jgi:hypothetical protein
MIDSRESVWPLENHGAFLLKKMADNQEIESEKKKRKTRKAKKLGKKEDEELRRGWVDMLTAKEKEKTRSWAWVALIPGACFQAHSDFCRELDWSHKRTVSKLTQEVRQKQDSRKRLYLHKR